MAMDQSCPASASPRRSGAHLVLPSQGESEDEGCRRAAVDRQL